MSYRYSDFFRVGLGVDALTLHCWRRRRKHRAIHVASLTARGRHTLATTPQKSQLQLLWPWRLAAWLHAFGLSQSYMFFQWYTYLLSIFQWFTQWYTQWYTQWFTPLLGRSTARMGGIRTLKLYGVCLIDYARCIPA